MGGSRDQKRRQSRSTSQKTMDSATTSADEDQKKAAEHLKKAQMESKIRERVDSEARAFDVVNRLIEPGITAEFLLRACQFIDHSHYEDIVEERSISHVCGYPLCNSELKQVAKKKYHISTKSNTVYDITERKKFCSNKCYHASEHLRKQIPQTPVWTRRGSDKEPFHLLQHEVSSHLEGEEVIGGRMFDWKEEMLLMEKLDQRDEKGSRPPTAMPAQRGRVSVEESRRLSDQLVSLSTEEDLERDMATLSLSTEDGNVKSSAGTKPSGSGGSLLCERSTDVEKGKERQAERAGVKESEDREKTSGEKAANIQSDCSVLESSMKNLILCDSGDLNSGNSDEKCAKNVDGTNGGSDKKSPAFDHSAVSKTLTALTCPDGADSDDDQDDLHVNTVSTDKSLNLRVSQIRADCSVQKDSESSDSLATADTDQLHEKSKESALKQLPGESKSAYLMRLLDRRKHLLLKVADVQSDLPNMSAKSESDANISTSSIGSDSKAKTSKSSGSKTFKEREELTGNPKANCPSNKEKSPRASQRPSLIKGGPLADTSPLSAICQIISTWVSAETLDYLGFSSAQSAGSKGPEDNSTNTFLKDPEMQRKYQNLCQRLAGQEKDFDDVLGEEDVKGGGDRKGGKQPLPDYRELKEQTDEFQLKVQQFMAGSMTIKSKPTHTQSDEDGGDADGGRPVVLPDIDSHNQILIRRRIMLERLDRTMPSLLPPLGLSVQDVSATLRELVFTFSLSSHNIVLKPVEWTLAAIILLKMMESKSTAVSAAFRSPTRSAAFNTVLSGLDHSPTSLGELVQHMLTQRTHSLQVPHTLDVQ